MHGHQNIKNTILPGRRGGGGKRPAMILSPGQDSNLETPKCKSVLIINHVIQYLEICTVWRTNEGHTHRKTISFFVHKTVTLSLCHLLWSFYIHEWHTVLEVTSMTSCIYGWPKCNPNASILCVYYVVPTEVEISEKCLTSPIPIL
jgi:hypothetical protein